MQAPTLSPGTSTTMSLGIHDLLEQSISRSRLGASNHTAVASLRSSPAPTSRSSSGTPRPQSKSGRSREHAELQAVSQAATSRASTASLEEDGNVQSNQTAMPARRQLEYSSLGSKSDRTVNFSRTDRSPSKPQVLLPKLHSKLTQLYHLDLPCPIFRHLQKRKQPE